MSSEIKVTNIKHSSSGSNNLVLASDGSATIGQISSSSVFPAGGTGNPISVAVIADEKGHNNQGGTSYTSFTQRTLNQKLYDPDNIVTISSNKFTLGAGTYLIQWSAPAYQANGHASLLYNVTGTADLKNGSTEYTGSSGNVTNRSVGSVIHTITTNNEYEIRHRVNSALGTYGMGVAHGWSGYNNYYTIVVISKLK